MEIDDIRVEILTRGESAKHLGQMITFQQQETTEIRSRIRAAWATLHKKRQELTSRSHMLRHRLRLFDAVVSPTMNHASATRTPTKVHERMIQSTQRKMLPLIIQTKRRYNKIVKRKDEINEKRDNDDLGSTGDESEDGTISCRSLFCAFSSIVSPPHGIHVPSRVVCQPLPRATCTRKETIIVHSQKTKLYLACHRPPSVGNTPRSGETKRRCFLRIAVWFEIGRVHRSICTCRGSAPKGRAPRSPSQPSGFSLVKLHSVKSSVETLRVEGRCNSCEPGHVMWIPATVKVRSSSPDTGTFVETDPVTRGSQAQLVTEITPSPQRSPRAVSTPVRRRRKSPK